MYHPVMVAFRVSALIFVASCTHTPPREASPMPLPTVPVPEPPAPPEPPENVEGTYEIDQEQSSVKMRMTLVFEDFGRMKRTKQTAFMKTPEESKGHWRRDGDVVVFTIDAIETRCTRRADTLVCGDAVLRLRR
jgi:hypothetical protein